MIHYDDYLHIGNKRLNLASELVDESRFVFDGYVGNYIDGEHTVFLGIIETMYLNDVPVGIQYLCHLRLQFCMAVFTCSLTY